MTDDEARGTEVQANDVTARYYETETERVLSFEYDSKTAAIVQNLDGYAMLKVRPTADGEDLERYYGFEIALDHAAELLQTSVQSLPIPDPAEDMGM